MSNVVLTRLAHSADKYWHSRLHSIREVQVLAMVRGKRNDIQDTHFAARCRVKVWELPVVELKLTDKTLTRISHEHSAHQ